MAVEKLPLFGDLPQYRYSVVIDGISYIFEYKWNVRADSWYLSILQPDETCIRAGIRIVKDWNLIFRDVNELLFEGVLYVLRADNGSGDPVFEDFPDATLILQISGDDLFFTPEGSQVQGNTFTQVAP